ncbi:alpha/beta fold hydrolase [Actinomyces vulturis]|uniref:alpha/beta fold hydrolase n=1 Tax=Actinomyces vulturis TaxID=1857645 RepID=UPI0008313B5A|nr:alpha/beta fold hydrolase [Actinomyces vulturis]
MHSSLLRKSLAAAIVLPGLILGGGAASVALPSSPTHNDPAPGTSTSPSEESGDDAAESEATPAPSEDADGSGSNESTNATDAPADSDAGKEASEPAPTASDTPTAASDDKQTSPKELDEQVPESAQRYADGYHSYKIPDPTPGGQAVGAVPDAALLPYYAQSVEFNKYTCRQMGIEAYRAECGYAIMPIDYSNPAAGNLAIAVIKVPASSGHSDSPVFFNPGGPGGSGVNLVSGYESDSGTMGELNKNHDLVGFDPRGVGVSLPFAQCSSNKALDEMREVVYDDDDPNAEHNETAATDRYVHDCFNNTGRLFGLDEAGRMTLMSHLGTANAVRDLDVLRSIFGAETLDYVGYSYGTRLGYVFAQTFPNSVGRLVLDGVVNPMTDTAPDANQQHEKPTVESVRSENEALLGQAAGFQQNFEDFAHWCVEAEQSGQTWQDLVGNFVAETPEAHQPVTCALTDQAYQPHSGDVADDSANVDDLTKAFQNLTRPLLTKPISDARGDGRPLTYGDALTGMRQALYSQSLWKYAVWGLHELTQDDGFTMMILADMYEGREKDGSYDSAQAAFTAIRCADSANPDGFHPEAQAILGQLFYAASPFQDPGAPYNEASGYDYCDIWPFAGNLQAGTEINGLPDILVISTTHDPATPYENGPILAKAVGGTMISVEGSQHTAFGHDIEGYECVNRLTLDYLNTGKVPEPGEYPEVCTVESFRATVAPEVPAPGQPELPAPGDTPSTAPLPVAPNIDDLAAQGSEMVKHLPSGKAATSGKEGNGHLARTGADSSLVFLAIGALATGILFVRKRNLV